MPRTDITRCGSCTQKLARANCFTNARYRLEWHLETVFLHTYTLSVYGDQRHHNDERNSQLTPNTISWKGNTAPWIVICTKEFSCQRLGSEVRIHEKAQYHQFNFQACTWKLLTEMWSYDLNPESEISTQRHDSKKLQKTCTVQFA